SDVDTDQTIPQDCLQPAERTGLAVGHFSAGRGRPLFVITKIPFRDAKNLGAGADFGKGSWREHAVWALDYYGFRAVISPRFADIFRNNCLKVGLVPVELSQDVVTRIMRIV